MIIVDVETSGVVHYKSSILSVGALDFDEPDNRLYEECRVWEGAHVNDESLAHNGFTFEQVTDSSRQSEAELVKKFIDWAQSLEEHTLVGQNVSFDRDFLQSAAERAKINWPFAFRTIDTHSLAYMHMVKRGKTPPVEKGRSALDLDAVMKYTGIPEEPMPHNALTGALAHAEVTSRLLYDKKLLPEFEQYEIPWRVE
jgi:DNA polymerase III epsilon subunit-like protein